MMVSDNEPRIVDSARRTSSRLISSPAAPAHSSDDASSGCSPRDLSFVGNGDGNFLTVLERYRLKRPQYAIFVDSLNRLLHTR